MIDKVLRTIDEYKLVNNGEKIVVAVSGGPDSVALLLILARIARQMKLSLVAAHFNHLLRGAESDEDENYCRQLCHDYKLPFVCERMDKTKKEKGVSPEDFYRRQRYSFLNKTAKKHNAHKIALGHNMQDQAHTVLLNLLRGSGLDGLKGILPMREGKFIRPLIETTRREIISYLDEEGVAYRLDSSNKSTDYLRNKIRKDLIPLLQAEYNPSIEEKLAQTAKIICAEDDFIKKTVAQISALPHVEMNNDYACLDVQYLQTLHRALRLRLLKTVLENMHSAKQGFSFVHIMAVEKMTGENVSGKSICLPGQITARLEYGKLHLERTVNRPEKSRYEYRLTVPGVVFIKEKGLAVGLQRVTKDYIDRGSNNKVYMDLDKIRPPLVLRNRREGDWFEPLGMRGRKKIKDFFIDRKIPRPQREKVLLLADDLSVLWIERMHMSERVKITDNTRNILEMEIVESENLA
ncbi:MAG TPA: tRNA lysidine(34) synthetase TilS [Deltaproteobacteria bacterium]|nr:tRNA lysidine(34) synthetase TilS [Deltaproteobacteria bacterium]